MKKINYEKMYEEIGLASSFCDKILVLYNDAYRPMMKRKTVRAKEEKALEYLKIMVANLEEAINEKEKV